MRGVYCIAGLLPAIALFCAPAEAAPTETVIHAFRCCKDGIDPRAALVADSKGNFYTTTVLGGASGKGTIVKLTPPAAGRTLWRETILYSFTGGADGGTPLAGLIADSKGNLYTTTSRGGASSVGTVVKLAPPAAGQTTWTETVLHSFGAGTDGAYPYAALIADSRGNLYTTTAGGGASGNGSIVKLALPASGQTTWTETVLYSFQKSMDAWGPEAALTPDSAGNLYTTTIGFGNQGVSGAVVELKPPAAGQKNWAESALYQFPLIGNGFIPFGAVTQDTAGNLYTTTNAGESSNCASACGTVAELSPPVAGQTGWTATTLYTFQGAPDASQPWAGLLADGAGNLYTTTAYGGASGYGAVVKLAPPAAGQTSWTETVLHSFAGGTDGTYPDAGLIADKAGNLYTTTAAGGSTGCRTFGCGTIVKLSGTGFVVPAAAAE